MPCKALAHTHKYFVVTVGYDPGVYATRALALEATGPSSNDPITCTTREIANQTFVKAYMVNRVCRI
ncbi:hypothetical protein K443DRAFT_15409 [Laccaria amethystina LaAM-08-1]|uniref:Uncharacterized protein n=1 Tax=Laccaria amethystina LaAM-08-1 TaxID=1095629 RepID=A0A0C9WXU2_9AGAR|nr:hypothetical protein K443DRAFT_15409 [Laccaria amethystina LaAM-08-1]